MDWIIKTPWMSIPVGALCIIGLFVVCKYAYLTAKAKWGAQIKGAHLDIEMQPPPASINDVLIKFADEFKNLLTQSTDEQKQERAVLIKGLSAALEWISKQPGANGRISDARTKLEDWLIARGLQ